MVRASFGSIGAILVSMVSIQCGASFAKKLFPVLGAEGATLLRCGIAAAILWIVWRPWRRPLSRSALAAVVLYGLALGSMNLLFYKALERIPLGIAVALEFTGPLGVALFASKRAADLVWAFLAAIGIVLILPLTSASDAVDPIGGIFALAAGGCWALYIIYGQRVGRLLQSGQASAIGMLVAAFVAVPLGISRAGSHLGDTSVLPLAFLVAILSSALPYSLEMVALKRMPAKTFGIMMSLEPAVAALSGLAFLSEKLSFVQWIAIACVIAASAGSTASVAPAPAPPPTLS